MKLFKLMATTAVTAVAATALAISVGATEVPVSMSAEYSYDTAKSVGTVTLKDIQTTAEQKTLLILHEDVNNVVDTDIVQIDQDATLDSVAVGDLAAAIDKNNQDLLDTYNAITNPTADNYKTLTDAWIESEDYYVRVGGGSDIEKYTLVVNTTKTMPTAPSTEPEEPEEPEGTLFEQGYGDLDGSGEPDPYDASLVLGWYDYEVELDDNQMLMGDIDKSGEPDPYDASLILGWYDYEVDDNFGLF